MLVAAGKVVALDCEVSLQKYPPRKDFVRAVSLQTGYLIKATGNSGCILYYLTQVDPRGEHSLAEDDGGTKSEHRMEWDREESLPQGAPVSAE